MPLRDFSCTTCNVHIRNLVQPLQAKPPVCDTCSSQMAWMPGNMHTSGILFTNTIECSNVSTAQFKSEADIRAWKRANPGKKIATNAEFNRFHDNSTRLSDDYYKKRGYRGGLAEYRRNVSTGSFRER